LFDVYYLSRYGRAVALELSQRAARINRIASLLTLACVAASLLAGGVAFLAADALKPYWAVLNVASVVVAMWAAIMSYSEKEFEYDSLASRFQELALAVEHFSQYAVYSDKYSPEQIDGSATEFHQQYGAIMSRTKREYKRYDDRHMERINAELRGRLPAWFIREPGDPLAKGTP